jgi:hypothetical protein
MVAKRDLRPSQPRISARTRLRHRTEMVVIAIVLVVTTALVGAAPALADTGSVYYDGNFNVGAGHDFFNGASTTGFDNVGLDFSVMPALTTGSVNVGTGIGALASDSTGYGNVANGFEALFKNDTGRNNVAAGTDALLRNTSGFDNLATGSEALSFNTTGHDNLAAGTNALLNNTTGSSNLALGTGAGQNLTTGSNNVDIANAGTAGESRTIRIGTTGTHRKTFLAGVSGTSLSGTAQPVLIKTNGQLGTAAAASALTTKAASANSDTKLRARNRHEDREIATLKREVARLSRG